MTQVKPSYGPDGRVVFLDFLRVVACFMVIVVHACEPYYFNAEGLVDFSRGADHRFWVSIIDGACRPAVPLFVMASSYLLVPLRTSASVFFRRRLIRVFVPFVIWSVLYAVLPGLYGQFSAEEVQGNLVRLTYNFLDHAGHLWFIYMLIGAYLVMPIISPWLEKVSRRGEEAFLAVWFCTTFYAYLHYYLGNVYGECVWNEFHAVYYYSGYIGYLVLAHYIRKYIDWSTARSLAIGTAAFIVGFIPTAYLFYISGDMYSSPDIPRIEMPWRFCTPNVALMSFGLFVIFKAIRRAPKWLYTPTLEVSRLSYGMYLMHMFFLTWYTGYLFCMFSTPVSIMLVALATFVSCIITTKAISLIPGGKYIVG